MNAEWIMKQKPVTQRWVRGGLRWDRTAAARHRRPRCFCARCHVTDPEQPRPFLCHSIKRKGKKKKHPLKGQRPFSKAASAASANIWTRATVATATCAARYEREKSGRIIATFQPTFHSSGKLIASVFLCSPATLGGVSRSCCQNQTPLEIRLIRSKAHFTEVIIYIRASRMVESLHPLFFPLSQCKCDPNLVHNAQICCHKNEKATLSIVFRK